MRSTIKTIGAAVFAAGLIAGPAHAELATDHDKVAAVIQYGQTGAPGRPAAWINSTMDDQMHYFAVTAATYSDNVALSITNELCFGHVFVGELALTSPWHVDVYLADGRLSGACNIRYAAQQKFQWPPATPVDANGKPTNDDVPTLHATPVPQAPADWNVGRR
jgi:hypothetical protein